MLLAIDVGNTNVTIGVFDGEKLIATWRLASDRERLADEYAVTMLSLLQSQGIERADIHHAVIASVVPLLSPVFEELCRRYFQVKPLRVGAGVKTGMRIHYEARELGPDRIVDAVADLRCTSRRLIVVHLGTGDCVRGGVARG